MPGSCVPVARQADSSGIRLLRLTHLEVEGFKSFRDRAVIGPLSDFTCVVGPNGCGKSVLGEAVAFALGGNRKMLRTGNLAGLLNQELAAAGHRTAEVLLHMEVMQRPQPAASTSPPSGKLPAAASTQPTSLTSHQPQHSPSYPTSSTNDPMSPDRSHAALMGQQQQHTASSQQHHTQQGQAGKQQQRQQGHAEPQQHLKLKRVLRGGASKGYIMRPGSASWRPVSQAELQAELAPYGIDTLVVDRYIVTQSRQAVDVGDAVGLVKQLEALTGDVDYEAAIGQHSTGMEQLAASLEETKSQIDRLVDEREVLEPAVAHWQEVQQLEAAVAASKLQLLSDQQEHGNRLIKAQGLQVESAQHAAAAAAEALQSAEGKESELLLQRSAQEKELLASKRREEQLAKKVSKVTAAAAAAEVQHASATSALKDNTSLLKALQKKLAQHDKQESQHKTLVEDGTKQLRALQEAAAAAQDRLTAARQAAAAAEAAKPGADRAGSSAGAAAEETSALLRLQQQARKTEQQLQVLTARQVVAAAKATRAAKSVETLQQKADAAAAAAAEADQVLAAAQDDAQAAAAAVAASRHRSRAAEDKWRTAEVQQQSFLDQVEAAEQQQGGQQHTSSNNSNNSTPGCWPSYDTAVQHLAAASASRQLPGQFHGRLCNVVSVAGASLQPAVNAALQERCNLASTLIVSDRATAAAVIEHFRQNKVGTVNCKILSELQQQRTSNNIPAAAAAAAGCTPVLQLLQHDRQAVPGLQPLLEQLLGGWLLVESREVALGLLHLRQSMVTRSGEVFKADGEIVATIQCGASSSGGGRGSKLPAYTLPVGQPAPIAAPTRDDNLAASHQGGNAAANKAAADAVRRLKQQLAAAQKHASSAEQELEAANLSLLQHEQQQAAADSRLQRLQQQQQHGMRVRSNNAEQLKQQLRVALQQQEAAAGELAAAEAELVDTKQQHKQLQHQLTALAGAEGASGRKTAVGRRGKAGASTAAAEQQAAQQAATEAEAAVEDAWRQVHKAEQQQKRAASRAAAISKEVAKAEAAVAASDVALLQAKLDGFQQQLSDMQADLSQARSEAAGITSKLKPLRQHLAKAAAAKDKAAAALEQAQETLLHAQAELLSLQQQQEHRAQQLQQLQAKHESAQVALQTANAAAAGVGACKKARTTSSSQELADASAQQQQQEGDDAMQDIPCAAAAAAAVADVDMEDAANQQSSSPKQTVSKGCKQNNKGAGSSQGSRWAGLRRSTRATVIADSSSSASDADDECSSSSSGEDSDAPAIRKRCGSAAAAAAAAGSRRRTACAAHDADTLPSAAALVKHTAELRRRQQQLDEQQLELQQEYSAVDRAALERDLAALQALAAATATLQRLQAQHEAAATAFEQLLDERYSRLLTVLQSLNAQLDAVYSQLTGGCGKAYCSYTAERRLLFSQGVTLHVQPDGRTWRKLGMLSGGQRSLATLALSFALQTLFPSPFYFFDEVDCALDTSAAARVAAYVCQQCSGPSAAQFLLVSHKPVVYESAGCLLGMYSNGRGSSAAVVGHFG